MPSYAVSRYCGSSSSFVLDFDDTAKTLSIIVGVAVIGLFATTAWRPAPLKLVPVVGHAVIDFVVGAVLVVAPFPRKPFGLGTVPVHLRVSPPWRIEQTK